MTVEALQIDSKHLNTQRMLDIMAISTDDGAMPLYLHTVHRILREMRISQQEVGGSFDYAVFKQLLLEEDLSPMQLAPLKQRLALLESLMPKQQPAVIQMGKKKNRRISVIQGTDWEPKVSMLSTTIASATLTNRLQSGQLTIVDLSCPCVSPEAACSLFNICLSIFMEQDIRFGRIVALDEAHKARRHQSSSLGTD